MFKKINYKHVFIGIVCFKGLSYWLISWIEHPNDPMSTIAIYRIGDIQFFPVISALSRLMLTESILFELKGAGVISAPIVPLLIHAICYRFFGIFGFILADILFTLIFYIVFSTFLKKFKVPQLIADSVSLLVVSGSFLIIKALYYAIFSRGV